MVVVGYRIIGDKTIEVFRVDGTNADEKSKEYLEGLHIPVDEEYVEKYLRSNPYFLIVKIHEDGTSEIIDTAYNFKKRGGRKASSRTSKRKKTVPQDSKWNSQRIKEVEKIKSLATPEGILIKELIDHTNLLPLDRAISILDREYNEKWEKDPLVYADAYIDLLEDAGDYYVNLEKNPAKKLQQTSAPLNPFELWLEKLEGGNLRKAVNYYKRAVKVSTRVALIYFPDQNYPEEAERYFRRAVTLAEKIEEISEPPANHWVSFNNLGTHYYETNRPKDALPLLQRALEYVEDKEVRSVILHNIALCHADLGNKREAVENLVLSICIHYSSQHEYGTVNMYDRDIERIIELTGDSFSDALSLKLALDFIGGTVTKEEFCKYLQMVNREEWPLSMVLYRLICEGQELSSLLDEVSVECSSLLTDVSKKIHCL